jgi:20S proteasome subunit alpha 6
VDGHPNADLNSAAHLSSAVNATEVRASVEGSAPQIPAVVAGERGTDLHHDGASTGPASSQPSTVEVNGTSVGTVGQKLDGSGVTSDSPATSVAGAETVSLGDKHAEDSSALSVSVSLTALDTASTLASVPQPSPVALNQQQTANPVGYSDTQVRGAPLQAASSMATLPDLDSPDSANSSFSAGGAPTVMNGNVEDAVADEGYQDMPSGEELELIVSEHQRQHGHEHLPEPPASPTSNTLLSTSSDSTYGDRNQTPVKADGKGARTPSANRLSISYAGGNRRLVIDADVVSKLKVFRTQGMIEVLMNFDKDDSGLKGIFVRSGFGSSSSTSLITWSSSGGRSLRSDEVISTYQIFPRCRLR